MHDFYSDTKTKPTLAMRQTVLTADVGDEQKFEDPTTTELCRRVAEMLGKEAAVFLPSGTMCNEIAINVHVSPGDEVICERSCHIICFEGGAPAAFSGAMVHPIDGDNGTMTPEQVKAAIRPASRYAPRSRLFCVEQTANLAGGYVWPLDQINAVSDVARDAGLATHMDGARLMNAMVASGITASQWVKGYDTCWIDFSKGLGAPVGAVLAGSAEFIDEAWAVKQRIGGAMRQSGILAAMCLYALDHHIERLADDHALAKSIAGQLASFAKVEKILPVNTNIIIFDLTPDAPNASDLVSLCESDDLAIGAFGDHRIRIVTHLDVDEQAGEALCQTLERHLG